MTLRVLAAGLALVAATAGLAVAQNGPRTETAPRGALLRGLDRTAGTSEDFLLRPGETHAFGHLQVVLQECRYPRSAPLADAFAHLTILDTLQGRQVYSGWMVASSPALSALDHARYDVWVLRCNTDAADASTD